MHVAITRELRTLSNSTKAGFLQRFFKTGPGQYAEGDVFIGLTVPQVRVVVKKHRDLPLADIETLLHDPIHEFRLTAVLLLVEHYKRGDAGAKQKVFDLYIKNRAFVNNWDLVDSSADKIVGAHLFGGDTSMLDDFARSSHLWTQRIAMIATFHFIRQNRFDETVRIAEILLHHPHDLIHKAVGWMLREVGKRNRKALEAFLDRHAATMPRTMLRYAIEKFDESARTRYLAMKVLTAAAGPSFPKTRLPRRARSSGRSAGRRKRTS